MLRVRTVGLDEAGELIAIVGDRVDALPVHVMQNMAGYMRDVVHIITGYLHDSIHAAGPYAYADAPYAGYETDRGGSHDFVERGEDRLTDDLLADWLMRGL